MRERLFLLIICIISPKTVLKTIQETEPNVNRRDTLIKNLLLVPKLANTVERISLRDDEGVMLKPPRKSFL